MNNNPFFTLKTFVVIFMLTMFPYACYPAGQDTLAAAAGAKADKTLFNARGANETLLHIEEAGYYSIQVTSKQGTQVTIVDRMTGPYRSSGSPGQTDGRLDLILDNGTYKLRLNSHPNGSGEVKLKILPYREAKGITEVTALPYLQDLELVGDSLNDLQQQAFWIQIKERQDLRLEALGRNLKNALLWRDGKWLEGINPTVSQFEPIPSQPMTHVEFHHDLNPGLYLLVCYGGPALTWPKETNEHPFYLRMGVPELGRNGQYLLEVSPFGRDTFVVDGKTNFFQLLRQDKKPTSLSISYWGSARGRFSSTYRSASISKESRDPWCIIDRGCGGDKQWVTVTALPGDSLELDFFLQQGYLGISSDGGDYWVSTLHSAQSRDAIDATAFLTRSDLAKPLKAKAIQIAPGKPAVRKINLLEKVTVFLFVEKDGTYVIEEDPNAGAKGRYQLQRFMIRTPSGFKPPPFQDAGTDFELTAGYHVLTIQPKSKGILHFALYEKNAGVERGSLLKKEEPGPGKKQQHTGQSVVWPQVTLPSTSHKENYTFTLNQQGGVDTGFVVRPLPMTLLEPLPVPLGPGSSVMIRVKHREEMRVKITGGNYRLKVDGVPREVTAALSPGNHNLELENIDSSMHLYNVKAEVTVPYTPPPRPELKKIEDIFPVLTGQKPLFRDFALAEVKEFLLQVPGPGLYRLETTGRLATRITVRTRTTTSLYSAAQNGIGRNALVQQYLKPGDYLVQVQPLGQSKGRAGIVLRRTAIDDVPDLTSGKIKRNSIAPDAAVRYKVHIAEPGTYHLDTFSLGKALTFRLDDNDGWPLLIPGKQGPCEQFFDPGTYFYYSLPLAVESRRVTFLKRVVNPSALSGKGPHKIELNQVLQNTWLETPDSAPDLYHTVITAPIRTELTTRDDMAVTIFKEDGSQVAVTAKGKWSGNLPAGTYRLAVKPLEKNNRVPYSLGLATDNLIPGLVQPVNSLPRQMTVSLGQDGLVDITSFGDTDVKAVLKDKDGRAVIAEEDDMAHDWNFKLAANLKAGQYLLEVSAALADSRFRPLEVRMQRRGPLDLPPQALPFSTRKALAQKVLRIPFNTGPAESLLKVRVLGTVSYKTALIRGDVLLAEGINRLYIPLPGQHQYTLLAWSLEDDPGEVRIDAEAVIPPKIQLTQSRQSFQVLNGVQIQNQTGLSFGLKSLGDKEEKIYYSPAPERPCLLIGKDPEGTLEDRGWLVSSSPRARVRVETAGLASGKSAEMVFTDLPLTFAFNQSRDIPLLLEVKSVNALIGAAVFPGAQLPGNRFRRTGMLAAASRTLACIPGQGEYRIHTWLTHPTPLLTSEKNRFLTGEQVTLTLTAYPLQKEIDFREVALVETRVEPGQSVWLQLNEGPQAVEMTLAHNLAAFSWFQGEPLDMAAALEKNIQVPLVVKGEYLYVVNTGDIPALFRAEKKGPPTNERITLDTGNGFEEICLVEGSISMLLPEIPAGMKLCVAGNRVTGRVWSDTGKLVTGTPLKQEKDFDFEYFAVPGGFLEILHGPGLVKVWLAPARDNGFSMIGEKTAAREEAFQLDKGVLSPQLQAWTFSLPEPRYVSVETLTPTLMALVSGEDILYLSASAFRTPHQLNHYLPAGTYQILTRPLTGTTGTTGNITPGPITLKTITPRLLDENRENEVRLIQPGEIQVFRFDVEVEGNVGVGLITENDTLDAQLFDEYSRPVSSGPLMLRKLPPGHYLVVVKARDVPVQYRPIVLGNKGSRQGVPQDVLEQFKKEIGQ